MRKFMVIVGLCALLGVLSFATVTSGAAQLSCPGAPPPRLTVGETAQVAQSFSSLRAGVGSNVVLRTMYRANNDQFEVIGGPVCSGAHYWWQVNVNGQTGWVTEGLGSTYWVEPATTVTPPETTPDPNMPEATPDPNAPVAACPNAPVTRLSVGMTAGPAQVYNSIRASIGSSNILATAYSRDNDTYTIVDGPVCAGPHYWWQVEFNGVTGWTTEGTGATYWMQPITTTTTTQQGMDAESTPEAGSSGG